MKHLLTALLILFCATSVQAVTCIGFGSSAACSGTMGNTATTDSDAHLGVNRIVVTQVEAICTGALSDIHIRVAYTNASDRNGTFVVYSDNGSNAPDELLWSSAFSQDGTSTAHWINSDLNISVAAGDKIFIGFISQSATTNHLYSATTGAVGYRGVVSDYSSPPASWSSVSSSISQTHNMESYVSY